MINSLPRSVVSLLVLGSLALSCSQRSKSTSTAPACPSDDPNQVIATYDGKNVTLKDIDEVAGKEMRDLEKQKFQLRAQAAEQVALNSVMKVEAAKVQKTEDEWFKELVEGKVPNPGDDEIAKVFEENKARMPPGSTLESMRGQIVAFLTQDKKREVVRGVQDEMKKKVNFQLKIAAPPEPRIAVEAKGPARGPADAKVTIVEFSDFQCPYCSRAENTVDQVMTAFAGKLRLVFRHYPLPFHEKAPKAAEASACAHEQGKFWEMHKQLFANQQALGIDELKTHAKSAGLDEAKFAECLDGGKMKGLVDGDMEAGKKAGVTGTPAFFINGILISGAQPFAEFERVINAELASAK
jgi:protein-disulfide isomerase